MVILRPVSFQSHEAHFLIKVDKVSPAPESGSGQHNLYTCWRVPHHLRNEPWRKLMTSLDAQLTEQLVVVNDKSKVKQVLSELESPHFIHT